ncbi:MAG: hypothetical protein K0S76_159 [Herbinix sp.]|jgi:hypothetical protein|nr:hypothetical protein [Herbinix sp.]
MVLSEDFLSLPTPEKLILLKTPDGVAQLIEWLSTEYTICSLAPTLGISEGALYKLCDRNPKITAVTGRPLIVKHDLSRPAAYRIILGYTGKRGEILAEYATAEEVWQNPLIHRYFSSFGIHHIDYYERYLTKINHSGFCQLSHLYSIVYAEINRRGFIKILKTKI